MNANCTCCKFFYFTFFSSYFLCSTWAAFLIIIFLLSRPISTLKSSLPFARSRPSTESEPRTHFPTLSPHPHSISCKSDDNNDEDSTRAFCSFSVYFFYEFLIFFIVSIFSLLFRVRSQCIVDLLLLSPLAIRSMLARFSRQRRSPTKRCLARRFLRSAQCNKWGNKLKVKTQFHLHLGAVSLPTLSDSLSLTLMNHNYLSLWIIFHLLFGAAFDLLRAVICCFWMRWGSHIVESFLIERLSALLQKKRNVQRLVLNVSNHFEWLFSVQQQQKKKKSSSIALQFTTFPSFVNLKDLRASENSQRRVKKKFFIAIFFNPSPSRTIFTTINFNWSSHF